jgi:Ca2+-binding EF-hand superfamily protein
MACSRVIAAAIAVTLSCGLCAVAQDDAKRPPRESGILFERLDANKDGTLTKEEVPEERQRLFTRLLRSSDKDGDGKLAREEFAAGIQDQPAEKGDAEKTRGNAAKERVARGAGVDRPGFDAGALLERLDANNDGKLTEEEIPAERRGQIAAVFNRADADSDGVVTTEEISTLRRRSASTDSARMAGGAVVLRALDADGDGALSSGEIENAAAALKKLDKNGDGRLTRDELGPPGGVAGFGGGGTAVLDRVRDMDKNQDGKISKDELPPRLQERFDALDANKDGSLDREELRQGLRRQISDRPGRGQDASPKGADPTQSN